MLFTDDSWQQTAPALLQHPSTRTAATMELLSRLPLEDDPCTARALLRLLCAYGTRSAAVSAELLGALPLLEAPVVRELLGSVAQLLGGGEEESEAVVEAAHALVEADRTLLLPVIGMLSEVELPERFKPSLAQLALDALPRAEESDLPTLVRSLVLSLNAPSLDAVLRALREHLSAVSTPTLALLLQVTLTSPSPPQPLPTPPEPPPNPP